jgi:hypothetical protein
MSQLVKHYWINRDTGAWATDTRFGLMMPNIKGLETQYQLTDQNDIPFFLSHVPEYFEYEITIGSSQLDDYQNNSNITIVSTTERQIEEEIENPESPNQPTGDFHTVTVYDVIYREPYVLEESEGLSILTEEEWNNEISSFDNRQQEKRYDILRVNRDKMLELTDWIVTKELEQGNTLDEDFKIWRQELRALPNSNTFPTSYPSLPVNLQDNEELSELSNSFDQVRNINMINDPLAPLPEEESPVQ